MFDAVKKVATVAIWGAHDSVKLSITIRPNCFPYAADMHPLATDQLGIVQGRPLYCQVEANASWKKVG